MKQSTDERRYRTKEQICTDYLDFLYSKGMVTKEDYFKYKNEKMNEVLELLLLKLYETENINGQDVSSIDAFYHFCQFVIHKDPYTNRPVWNSFVRNLFCDVEHHRLTSLLASRGLGKTVHEDTFVLALNGIKKIKDVSIGESIIQLEESSYNQKINVIVGKTEPYRKKLFLIKTRTGRQCRISSEHPLFTINGWNTIDNGLCVNDYVALSRRSEFNFGKNNNIHVARLLGAVVSEGYCGNQEHHVICKIYKQDLEYLSSLIDSYEKLFGIRPVMRHCGIKQNSKNMYVSIPAIYGICDDIKRKNSYEKEVPTYILNGDINVRKEFLKYLFEGDGCVDGVGISYSSMSEKLILQIQMLLQFFGINSIKSFKSVKFNGKEYPSYRLVMFSDNVLSFKNKIGFFSERKNESLDRICKPILEKGGNTNIDVIPKWGLINTVHFQESKCLSRKSAKRFVERFKKSGINHVEPKHKQKIKLLKESDDLIKLEKLSNSNIFWDKIVSIEPIGEQWCYDIQVGNGSNNYIADGFYSHNSFFVFGLYVPFKHFLWEFHETMIISNIPRMCKRNLRIMKSIIDNNELLMDKKETWKGEKNLVWSNEEIEFNKGMIYTSSLGSTPRSAHCNAVFLDDPLRDDNKYSLDDIENYVYGQLIPVIGRKGGRLVMLGTPQSFSDIFHTTMKDNEGNLIRDGKFSQKGFYCKAYPAIIDEPTKKVMLPEVYPFEKLMEIRKNQGERFFDREYMLICQKEDTAIFSYALIESCTDIKEKVKFAGDEDKSYVVGCLPDGEKVITNRGIMNIEDISKDGSINLLNNKGNFIKIKNYQRRYYDGELVNIKPKNTFKTTRFTIEHPILVYDGKEILFKKAGELGINDKLVYQRRTNGNNKIDISQEDIRIDRRIIDSFVDTFDFGRLVGLWLAEGHISKIKDRNSYRIGFSFNSKEIEYIDFIYSFSKRYFNRIPSIVHKEGYNCTEIYINSEWFSKFILKTCTKYARTKSIDLSYKYSNDFVKGLLFGFWQGDGCTIHDKRRNHQQIDFVSSSYSMIDIIQKILYNFDIMSSINKIRDKGIYNIKGKIGIQNELYGVRLSASESNKFYDLFNMTVSNTFLQVHNSFQKIFNDDYVIYDIDKLEKEYYQGFVNNFEVDCESHTYSHPGIIGHNCDVATSGAASADFSAYVVLELRTKKHPSGEYIDEKVIRFIYHEKGVEVSDQVDKIIELSQLYNNAFVLVEKNNIGIDLIQQLQHKNINVGEFTTDKFKKEAMIRFLVDEFRRRRIIFPDECAEIKRMKTELRNFGVRERGGKERMESLSGHDDLVMALALANKASQEMSGEKGMAICQD